MSTKTPNYQLNQWEPSDQFLRTDFNADNAKIDAALAQKAAAPALEQLRAEVAALPRVVTGTYYGDGALSKDVYLGFAPRLVYVCSCYGETGYDDSRFLYCGGLALPGHGIQGHSQNSPVLEVTSSGFRVYFRETSSFLCYTNKSGMKFHYLALK